MKQDLFERLQLSMHDVSYTSSDAKHKYIQFNEYQYDLNSVLRMLLKLLKLTYI